jgi:hypothetical protein
VSNATSLQERMQRRRQLEQRKQKKEQQDEANRAYIPLEIHYKEALQLSHGHLNERSQSSIGSAEELLQACTDDILFTIRVPTIIMDEENEDDDNEIGDLGADDALEDPERSNRKGKSEEDGENNGESEVEKEDEDEDAEAEEGDEEEGDGSVRRDSADDDDNGD